MDEGNQHYKITELLALNETLLEDKRYNFDLFSNIEHNETYITNSNKDIKDYHLRRDLFPGDVDLNSGFNYISLLRDSKKRKNVRALILEMEHQISWKQLHFMGLRSSDLSAKNYLLFEDISSKIPSIKNNNILSSSFFSENLGAHKEAIGAHEDQFQLLKNNEAIPRKKEFENIRLNGAFDYRLLAYVIGVHIALYTTTGQTYLDYKNASAYRIGTVNINSLGRGSVAVSVGLAENEYDIGTALVLLKSCGIKDLVILTDTTYINKQAYSGAALIKYMLWLLRNIMHTANGLGVGLEHFWAYLSGLHRIIKIHGHSDEGGLMRAVFSKPVYPVCQGYLLRTSIDPTCYEMHGDNFSFISTRTIIDQMLLFPATMAFSDPGVTIYGKKFPSIFIRHHSEPNTIASYKKLKHSMHLLFLNMKNLIAKITGLQSSDWNVINDYDLGVISMYNDRHLNNSVIIPFRWVDPNICNIYDLDTDCNEQFASFFSFSESSLFPKDTLIQNAKRYVERNGMITKNSVVRIEIPFVPQDKAMYQYILNGRYNKENGLGCMYFLNRDNVIDIHYSKKNLAMCNPDVCIAKSRWILPHSSFPNPFECFDVEGKALNVLLRPHKDDYFPGASQLVSDDCKIKHKNSFFCVTRVLPNLGKFTPRYVPKQTLSFFDKNLSGGYKFETAYVDTRVALDNLENATVVQPIVPSFEIETSIKINDSNPLEKKMKNEAMHNYQASLNEQFQNADGNNAKVQPGSDLNEEDLRGENMPFEVFSSADFNEGLSSQLSLSYSPKGDAEDVYHSYAQHIAALRCEDITLVADKHEEATAHVGKQCAAFSDLIENCPQVRDQIFSKVREGNIPDRFSHIPDGSISELDSKFMHKVDSDFAKQGYIAPPNLGYLIYAKKTLLGRVISYIYRVPLINTNRSGINVVVAHVSGTLERYSKDVVHYDELNYRPHNG